MTAFRRLLAAGAATALMTVSTAAAAAAPAPRGAASLSVARAATPAAHTGRIGANVPGATWISIGILAALTVGVLLLTGDDDDDDSDSN